LPTIVAQHKKAFKMWYYLSMKIQVLGSGCATCKKLFELTKKAVEELNLKTEVEYITDIQKIVAMGLMQSPVLVVDNKPVLVGFTSDIEKIKKLIQENM
jgi:small redox-active disulfide protein 2